MLSVIHSIPAISELIRKNNLDYFEPCLFPALRKQLIQVQQQFQGADNARETLVAAMKEISMTFNHRMRYYIEGHAHGSRRPLRGLRNFPTCINFVSCDVNICHFILCLRTPY
jgi:hypothetical protein